MRREGQGGKNFSAPRISRRDVGSLLAWQISALAGTDHDVNMIRERNWASITFSGIRHKMAISREVKTVADDAMSFLVETIANHEFDLPGHFVADILIDDQPGRDNSIIVEILTIIDPVAG